METKSFFMSLHTFYENYKYQWGSGLQLVEVIILKTALVNITTHWLALGCTIVVMLFQCKKILILSAFICKHQAFPDPNIWPQGHRGSRSLAAEAGRWFMGSWRALQNVLGPPLPHRHFFYYSKMINADSEIFTVIQLRINWI